MPDALEQLELLASVATAGPWHSPGLGEVHDVNHRVIAACVDVDPVEEELRPSPSLAEGDKIAAYIAAADPSYILRLLAVVKAAKAMRTNPAFFTTRELRIAVDALEPT